MTLNFACISAFEYNNDIKEEPEVFQVMCDTINGTLNTKHENT
jgi:hypothetical protein